jgi:hypothetical protein
MTTFVDMHNDIRYVDERRVESPRAAAISDRDTVTRIAMA